MKSKVQKKKKLKFYIPSIILYLCFYFIFFLISDVVQDHGVNLSDIN